MFAGDFIPICLYEAICLLTFPWIYLRDSSAPCPGVVFAADVDIFAPAPGLAVDAGISVPGAVLAADAGISAPGGGPAADADTFAPEAVLGVPASTADVL